MDKFQRPDAYNNLIKIGSLKESDRDEDELQQYVNIGTGMLKDAVNVTLTPHSRYMLAYDGIHSLAMAVLLHFGTRPGNGLGHRSVAFEKLADELKLDIGLRKIIKDAHDRRNETTYRSALPPLSHKDAENVITALSTVLPKAIALIESHGQNLEATPDAPTQ